MNRLRVYSAVLALVLGLGILSLGARPAEAATKKEKTYRTATYVLGGLTAYALLKKKTTIGLLGAAGTYYAYRKWRSEGRKDRPVRTSTRRSSRR